MKLGYKIAIGVFGTLGVVSLIQRFNNKPKVWYVDNFPLSTTEGTNAMAITLPPFGIIIKKRVTPKTSSNDPEYQNKQSLIHEMVHWKQFQKQGYLLFYLGYLFGFIKSGFSYKKNPYEQEALLKSGRVFDGIRGDDGKLYLKKVVDDSITPKNLAPKFYDDDDNNVYYYNNKNQKVVITNINKKGTSYVLPNGQQKPQLEIYKEA